MSQPIKGVTPSSVESKSENAAQVTLLAKLHREHHYERAALTYERSLSFGADSAWAFHNLVLTYFSMGDSTRCAEALRRLRAAAPADADSLELRLEGAAFGGKEATK